MEGKERPMLGAVNGVELEDTNCLS